MVAALCVILSAAFVIVLMEGLRVVEATTVDAADQRAHCQLVAEHEVRCTAVLEAPPEGVWSRLTDYASFDQIFASGWGSLHVKGAPKGDDTVHLTGFLEGRFGQWPVDAHIRHTVDGATWVAAWDEAGEDIAVNRGSWTLTPHARGTTVVYRLEVQVPGAWRPMVNVALLRVGANVVELVRAAVGGAR